MGLTVTVEAVQTPSARPTVEKRKLKARVDDEDGLFARMEEINENLEDRRNR